MFHFIGWVFIMLALWSTNQHIARLLIAGSTCQ